MESAVLVHMHDGDEEFPEPQKPVLQKREECCPCDRGGTTGTCWVAFAVLAVTAAVVLVCLEFAQFV